MESLDAVKRDFDDKLAKAADAVDLRFAKVQQNFYKHEARLVTNANMSISLK